MRRIQVLIGVQLAIAIAAGAQGIIHNNGDPRTLVPAPNCAASRFYVDDSTQKLYQANSGSPCVWSDPGATASSASLAPNMASWFVTQTCASQANCTQIFGDTKYVVDATSNSTTTLTCPDCAFTSADVGKVAWATTNGAAANAGPYNFTTFVCPQTTIASVTNSTTIVLSDACTASGSANVVFYWGHDDGPTLATLSGLVGCAVVHLATGNTFIMDSQPFFNTVGAGCNTAFATATGTPGPSLIGDGFGASQALIILTPNFAWANCATVAGARQKVCIGGAARSLANLGVWGTGLTPASNTNCANGVNRTVVSGNAHSGVIYGVNVDGICAGTSGMEGVELNNADENFDLGGAQDVGQYACYAYNAAQLNMRANDCINPDAGGSSYGLYVNNAQVTAWSNIPIANVFITGASGKLSSWFSTYSPNGGAASIEVASGAQFISYNDKISNGLVIDSGGTVFSSNTAYSSNITNNAGASFISNGGNSYTTIPGGTGNYSGVGVLTGTCRGTVTASSTLGLYGMGQFATPNCTSTTVNAGVAVQRVPLSGSVSYLVCTAGTGGVNASSGVVTVLKNGSATALTCTLGTGTSCFDVAHSDTPAVGDVYSMQVTSQAADTLANLKCTMLNW